MWRMCSRRSYVPPSGAPALDTYGVLRDPGHCERRRDLFHRGSVAAQVSETGLVPVFDAKLTHSIPRQVL